MVAIVAGESGVALFDPARCPTLVLKVGSSLLIESSGAVRRSWLEGLVAEIVERRHAGQHVLIVSSGAIALGARRLGFARGGRACLEDAQAAAAVGQIALAGLWAELLGAHGVQAAQLLLTLDDLEDRRRYLNASATLKRLAEAGVVPVLNENDTVATAEIRFGDNDRLAARAAQAAQAEGVILLSDVAGLYTADPRRDAGAQLLPLVPVLTPEIMAMAQGGSGSGMGSGGMATKLQAVRIAHHGGAHLAIIDGRGSKPLSQFVTSGIGTVFPAPQTVPDARKRWLAGRQTVVGQIVIDPGAAAALARGASLLAAGVVSVSGRFERGDVVEIVGENGTVLARGLAAYPSEDARRIAGRQTAEMEAALGYAPRSAFVHRDHLVILEAGI